MAFLRTSVLIIGLCASFNSASARAELTEFSSGSDTARQRALVCMTQAIAYEAGHEPLSGKQAVAEVILNRTRTPLYPASVCGVVYQGADRATGCQFTFTCDGSLRRRLSAAVMAEAREVAMAAISNQLPRQVLGAVNYHADYVSPYWAPSLVRVAKIGRHIFYRRPGMVTAPLSGPGYIDAIEPSPRSDEAGNQAGPTSNALTLASRTPQAFSLWGLPLPNNAAR